MQAVLDPTLQTPRLSVACHHKSLLGMAYVRSEDRSVPVHGPLKRGLQHALVAKRWWVRWVRWVDTTFLLERQTDFNPSGMSGGESIAEADE